MTENTRFLILNWDDFNGHFKGRSAEISNVILELGSKGINEYRNALETGMPVATGRVLNTSDAVTFKVEKILVQRSGNPIVHLTYNMEIS